ncbi:MAG: alkaline phosphatase family protein [Flavobacteriaceae bacterium]|nr:MAG: alkaline phosphatase family protein [Flavobacteriaceae bacterium]
MKFIKHILFFLLAGYFGCKPDTTVNEKPKLVIGIVIDQMRYDYLTRYYDRYAEGGFKRILNHGFSLQNAHYNYIPTYTAVGHASIYTGTTPNMHGIIGNGWYDKYQKKSIYCVTDTAYTTVGSDSKNGQRSPYRMLTTTITDQLRLSQNMNGKTIGIGIKDRSSILPAGHTATAAYWFDSTKESRVITSSFYMKELPDWVKEFNESDLIATYISKPWETLYDIKTYTGSLPDNNHFEGKFNGADTPTFPHNLPGLKAKNGGNSMIKETPFGNTITLDFAKAAIIGENLGKTDDTDFLAISFSSSDYIGHRFGPDAVETEDTYLRLDKDLAAFFSFLDQQIGIQNYTLFLTADHAVAQIPAYLQSLKIPAPYFDSKAFEAFVKKMTLKYFESEDIVEYISNYQLFLNKNKIKSLGLNVEKVSQKIADAIIDFNGVYKTTTATTLQTTHFDSGILNSLQNGYNQKFSGDIMIILNPGSIIGKQTGTTHGSGYSYDTHIPMIFYGNGIKKGHSAKRYEITDIASTLATLLQVEFPNGSTGKVIEEALNN